MRAGVILYNPQTKQILLIHRWKNGEEYLLSLGIEKNDSGSHYLPPEIFLLFTN